MVAAKVGLDGFPGGPQAEGSCPHLTGEHLLCQHLLALPGTTDLRWGGQGCQVYPGWGSRAPACLMCQARRRSHFNYRLNETGEKSLIGYLASATQQSLQTCQEGKETRHSAEQLNVAGECSSYSASADPCEGHRDPPQSGGTQDMIQDLGMWLRGDVLVWHV